MEAPAPTDTNMEVEESNNITEVTDVQQAENSPNIPSKECVKSDQNQVQKESSNEEVGEIVILWPFG